MRLRLLQCLALVSLTTSLTACSASEDMQGIDPKDYYAEHPIKNTVESRDVAYVVRFRVGATQLTADATDRMVTTLHGISPMAVDSILIRYPAGETYNTERRAFMVSTLRQMGHSKDKIDFQPSTTLARNEMHIDMVYTAVVTPDCPDWRTSPVTTYSNTIQGNFVCATETNLGLMVADPHDLVRGSGNVPPDTLTDLKAVDNYRSGASASTGGSPAPSGGGTAPSEPPASPPAPQ